MSSLVGMEHVQLGRCSGAASASSTSMNSTKPKPRCLGDDTSNAASRSLWESRAPRAPGFPVFMSRGISTSEAENETSPMPRVLPFHMRTTQSSDPRTSQKPLPKPCGRPAGADSSRIFAKQKGGHQKVGSGENCWDGVPSRPQVIATVVRSWRAPVYPVEAVLCRRASPGPPYPGGEDLCKTHDLFPRVGLVF